MTKTAVYFIAAILTYSLAQDIAHGQQERSERPASAASPMTYTTWKQQQVAAAQEQLQKLTQAKADQKQIQRAKDAVAGASELTIEEYISVYLTDLQEDRGDIVKLLEKLSKEESADLMMALLRRSDSPQKRPTTVPGVALNHIVK